MNIYSLNWVSVKKILIRKKCSSYCTRNYELIVLSFGEMRYFFLISARVIRNAFVNGVRLMFNDWRYYGN